MTSSSGAEPNFPTPQLKEALAISSRPVSAAPRKKLIEVSLPLDAINAEASRRKQKSPKGYPTNIHKWWAQIPVAAARGVLFAQLVDDPGAWPDEFTSPEAVKAERDRLHKLIGDLVLWDAKPETLEAARWEIARSLARGRGETPPPPDDPRAVLAWLAAKAPPVFDPFSGGGTIPLEAQRLGLTAIGSDLNPVAVLTSRALAEIPPRFARLLPVHPKAREAAKRSGWHGGAAAGLAEDLRNYGAWMRDEAFSRIGHLYPDATLADGSKAKVVAWLWARTVRSPNPAAKGAMVPLVGSFYPDEYATISVPKSAELVANPYRHGSDGAEDFFLGGMKQVLSRLAEQGAPDVPMTVYYSYKQSEKQEEGTASTGWATFLQALHDAGLILDGTWPLRTQNAGRLVARGTNALASAIILSCRRRPKDAPAISRGAFLSMLRAELPPAARQLRDDRIAATDFEQAIIGPGSPVVSMTAPPSAPCGANSPGGSARPGAVP